MKNTRNQTNLVDDKSVGCVWRRMGRTGCLSWKIILMSCVHHAEFFDVEAFKVGYDRWMRGM